MVRNGGWIRPTDRGADQMRLTNEFAEQVRTFGARMQGSVNEPERVILAEIEIATIGQLLPRIWQQTGSCVGAGGARAYSQAAAGDVHFRGDNETVKICFPFATYGVGRDIAGMKRPGEGSFGAAQAKACQDDHFGLLEWEDDRVPNPTIRNGWAQWPATVEKQWSHPSSWPVNRRDLQSTARKFALQTVTQARTTGEIVQALAQGYGVTVASMFGTRKSVVRGNVAIADWNDEWAHQMSIGGYWKHPDNGLLFLFDNQWGPSTSIHTPCPTLEKFGINGSMWVRGKDVDRILKSRDGEIFVHSATGGFPSQSFDWGNMGWTFA